MNKSEKSLKHRVLDLIISREAEHCENYARLRVGVGGVCFNYIFCGNTPPGRAHNHAAVPSILTHLFNMDLGRRTDSFGTRRLPSGQDSPPPELHLFATMFRAAHRVVELLK